MSDTADPSPMASNADFREFTMTRFDLGDIDDARSIANRAMTLVSEEGQATRAQRESEEDAVTLGIFDGRMLFYLRANGVVPEERRHRFTIDEMVRWIRVLGFPAEMRARALHLCAVTKRLQCEASKSAAATSSANPPPPPTQ